MSFPHEYYSRSVCNSLNTNVDCTAGQLHLWNYISNCIVAHTLPSVQRRVLPILNLQVQSVKTSVPCGFTIALQSQPREEVLHNSGDSLDGCPALLPLPQPRHTQRTVCTVAGTGVWRRGRGNDLQHSVPSAGIITGPDLWQDTSQQLPTRPGPKPEGWKVFIL